MLSAMERQIAELKDLFVLAVGLTLRGAYDGAGSSCLRAMGKEGGVRHGDFQLLLCEGCSSIGVEISSSIML